MSKIESDGEGVNDIRGMDTFAEAMHRTSGIVDAITRATSEEELGRLWDEFWVVNPDAGDFGAAETSFLVPILRRREARRILCVGNGKALEAHALAAAGFDVDSLDVSPGVNRFLKVLRAPREELERILKEPCADDPTVPAVHAGDVRNAAACPGPYDVVIARRMLQYFDGDDLAVVLDALGQRLSETGLLVLEDQNARKALRSAATWLKDRKIPAAWNLCSTDGEFFAAPARGTCRGRRVAWLIRSSG